MHIGKILKPASFNVVSNPKKVSAPAPCAQSDVVNFTGSKQLTDVQKMVKQSAKEIWQDMKMPEKLLPEIDFVPMPENWNGGTVLSQCRIIFPRNDEAILRNIADKGGKKSTMAHELRHIKQMHSIARLVGVDYLVDEVLSKKGKIVDREVFDRAVETLGRIDPNSKEGRYAKKCLKAYIEYPNMRRDLPPLLAKRRQEIYSRNFLEKDANAASKKYDTNKILDILFRKNFD